MTIARGSFIVVLTLLSIQLFSQKIEFSNPAEIIEQAKERSDSGRYDQAIALLRKIAPRDTAYNAARLRMTYAFIDNDQPDSALAICKQQLATRSDQRSEFLRLQGHALASKKEHDKAIEFLLGVLKEYPTMVNIRYSVAAMYFDTKQYEKASQQCFKALEINPFYGLAHKLLGRIAILQGRKVHGMMAMGMYIGVNPNDNGGLVLLNQFADNQVTDEGSVPAFGTNSAPRLDQMIRAKIALDEGFKSKFSISAPVIKQFELLFDQLNSLTPNPNDHYLKYYLPIYQSIKNNNQIEAFIYHILTSSSIEEVKKWRNKNDKLLSAFYTSTNTVLGEPRKNLAFPELGFPEKTNIWYDNSNKVSAIGKYENDKRQGKWLFVYSNGEKSAEGVYNSAGEKIGVWKYYYDNGKEKSVENMDTGETTVYSKKSIKSEHFFLKNDKIDGDVELFYRNGQRSKLIAYVAGERQGKQIDYYPDGRVAANYSNVQGKVNGPYELFHPNGKIKIRTTFKDDYYNGKFEDFFINGKLKSVGEYANGLLTGNWKLYYRNGQLSATGNYTSKGKPVGEWLYYDYTGIQTEKRNFDDEGRYHGENVHYEDGKQKGVWLYKKDILIKYTAFNPEGKVLFTAGNNNGNFYAKVYDIDGILRREGNFADGKADGLWKYYNRYGALIRQYNYKKDKLHGKAIEYFANGKTMNELTYENGEQNGLFTQYYSSGGISNEGWYVDGNPEQRWLTYFPDGTLEKDEYFITGQSIGHTYNFAVDGKRYSAVKGSGELIEDIVFYNSKGNVSSTKRVDGTKEVYEQFFTNKKLKARDELYAGNFSNHRTVYFPDGSIFYDYEMLKNNRHGKYMVNYPDGKLLKSGEYEDGERVGLWKTYHENGKLLSQGKYFEGKEDSVWTFYFDNGTVSSKGIWKDGSKHGNFIYYNPDGKAIIEKLFKHDEFVAYRSLTAATPGEWVNFTGTGAIDIKYSDGKPAWHQEYKNGLHEGVHKEYFSNGTVYEETSYVGGDRHGDYKAYHANGKLKEKTTYKNDNYDGTDEHYNESGTVISKTEYRQGYQHGKTVLYDKGQKVKEYNFWYGAVEQ
jgi:uncharacterized protein